MASFLTINGEGTITPSIIGRIFVDQLSLEELISLVNKSYISVVEFPDVKIEVRQYRPVSILLEG